MNCILTIVQYPRYRGFAGLLSMLLFRLPLSINKRISFWKLMGTGKGGTFDVRPNWRQWVVLTTSEKGDAGVRTCMDYAGYYGRFIHWWWNFFKCETYSVILRPLSGHGQWDKRDIFGRLPTDHHYNGIIAVLTRATIAAGSLRVFWRHVDAVGEELYRSDGRIMSIGIGEIPLLKQATFSVWENADNMKAFAYGMRRHREVIVKTRKEQWYREEMFVRLQPVASIGSIGGVDPLKGKL